MSTVIEELAGRGVAFEKIPHAKTFSSLEEAEVLGVHPEEVLKTIIVDTTRGHALVVVPGDRRVDMRLVEKALGDKHAHLADEDELRRDFPDIELGAFPPLGSTIGGVVTLVDPEVLEHETCVFSAGKTGESLRTRTQDLFRAEPIEIAPLVRQPEEG